ncbi:hypothetical protein NDU88_003317 [Pleurodeles waltl]|uniref:Uncharacterized protein n=1 Tax=Pleurodeles waltl TaxID=8319 RepID=A0AAV7TN90_PLEWA|nr:hypothetical protein NDU88_003317 [Pleurodeles waltl]
MGSRSTSRLFPAWLAKVVAGRLTGLVDKNLLRNRIEKNQEKMKNRYDRRKSTKEHQPGDLVRIKLQTFVKKGDACYGSPVTVKKVCGNAVMVEGGQWWNAGKVVKVKYVGGNGVERGGRSLPERVDLEHKASDVIKVGPHILRKSDREKRVPLKPMEWHW